MDQDQILQSHSTGIKNRNSNPLQINTVIRCLFGYLDLGNLKACRQVNKIWNAVAEPLLRKRCKITFGRDKVGDDGKTVACTPKDFFEAFSASQTAVRFTSFRFLSADYLFPEVDDFFEEYKQVVTTLEIDGINLINEDGSKVETHDISPWIKDSPITLFSIQKSWNFNPFDGTVYRPTQLVVPLNCLNAAEHLHLHDYNIVIEPGIQISPTTLGIGNVTISQNGKNLTEYCINDFIRFKEGSNVWLDKLRPDVTPTTLILNFGEDFIASHISLSGNTRIINWRMSRCSIDKLCMMDVPVLDKNGMKIRTFSFANASVDLAALSKEVKNLMLVYGVNEMPIQCSEPIILSKLALLVLDVWHSAALTHFVNCLNLVQLCICDYDENIIFNLNLIPRSVKKLKIFGLLRLDGHIDVEELIIRHSSLSDATRILAQIQTKTLILDFCKNEWNDEMVPFLQFLTDITLYIGPIYSFMTNNFSEYVDKQSEYYVFQNQKGKAINEQEFTKFVLLPTNE